jgi:hypothetical protein
METNMYFEMMKLAEAFAHDMVNAEVTKAAEAGEVIDDEQASRLYVRFFNQQLQQFQSEIAQFQSKSNGGGSDMVYIYNAMLIDLDSQEQEKPDRIVLTLSEFNRVIADGTLMAQPGRTARVYGATKNLMEEYSMEDFENQGERDPYTGEIVIEVKWAEDIVEKISMDQYLEIAAYGKTELKAKMLDESEIKYGRAEGGRWAELLDNGYAIEDIKDLSVEQPNPDWRSREEQAYYAGQLRTLFEAGFTSHKDLYLACAGKLFSLSTVGKVFKPNGDTSKVYRDGNRLIVSDRSIYTLPYNCLSREDREELLEMYRDIRGQLLEDKVERSLEMDMLANTLVNKIRGLFNIPESTDVIRKLIPDSETAWAVMRAAKQFRLVTGELAFTGQKWNVVVSIAKGIQSSTNGKKDAIAPELIKELGPELADKLETVNLTPEESKLVLDTSNKILNLFKIKSLPYRKYKAIAAIANKRQ